MNQQFQPIQPPNYQMPMPMSMPVSMTSNPELYSQNTMNYSPYQALYKSQELKNNFLKATDQERFTALVTKIYDNLSDNLLDKQIALNPLNINNLLLKKNSFNNEELTKIYKHLINYTYAATDLEVKNNAEVNMYLKEIHRLLKTLVKEEPKTT
jgi:hypothetical protein